MSINPSYLHLLDTGELEERAAGLEGLLQPCRACPRACGARRLEGGIGPCFGGRLAAVASWCDHHGEEPPISGRGGSGTLFLAGCNLRCVYCQNAQISQRFHHVSRSLPPEATCIAPDESGAPKQTDTEGRYQRKRPADELDAEGLARVMLELQARGCHNLNWVSPTHFAPQLVAGLAAAARAGLRLPIVYNTNGYDSLEVIRLLEGIVDIYLPDLKYADAETGREYSRVRDYPAHARAALAEMWRQAGPLELGPDGTARRGMIVRHLVLPNGLADSEESLRWLREACGPEVTLSLMAQYYPTHHADRYPLLARGITPREYERVVNCAQKLGFTDLLVQDTGQAPEYYRPDFEREHPFE